MPNSVEAITKCLAGRIVTVGVNRAILVRPLFGVVWARNYAPSPNGMCLVVGDYWRPGRGAYPSAVRPAARIQIVGVNRPRFPDSENISSVFAKDTNLGWGLRRVGIQVALSRQPY